MSTEIVTQLTFNDVLPVQFRVTALLQVAIHLWYALVYICYHGYSINMLALLNLSYSTHKYSSEDHNSRPVTGDMATVAAADLAENQLLLSGIRSTATKTLGLNVLGLVCLWSSLVFFELGSAAYNLCQYVIPAALLAYTLFAVFRKGDSLAQNRVHSTLKRVLVGRINSATMRTNDILLSDTLTSFSKVINDAACIFWMSYMPAEVGYNYKVEAVILAYPALVRIKQCFYEYRITRQKQHVFNLLKYTASLGPVVMNLLIKAEMTKMTTASDASSALNTLNRWWYMVSAFSAAYSFVWDIRMDWGFEAFEVLFSGNYRRFMLLRDSTKLVYQNTLVYYSAIGLDFALRFIWVFKIFVIKERELDLGVTNRVGNFLFGLDFMSLGFVTLELLEIFRRWMWCFFRLESDVIKLQLRDEFARAVPLANLKES